MTDERLDGFGRHRSALLQHSDNNKISPLLVVDRSSNARSEALKYFFTARDKEDFYFEDILNSFIALAQYPINFAIFRDVEADPSPPKFWTHFCSDKLQEASFLSTLRDSDGRWSTIPKNMMFRLFPDLLKGPSFYIVIFTFNPKTTDFQIVPPARSKFPVSYEQEKKEGFNPQVRSISTPMEYLASCADHFFQFMWDAFDTDFQPFARSYLKASLRKLKVGQLNWMARQEQLEQVLTDTVFPHPGPNDWIETLQTTFSSVLNDAADGVSLVSSMMRDHQNGSKSGKGHPPNMFLAHRMFDREPDAARNKTGEQNLGYLYDTSFLVPEMLHKNFRKILEKLRDEGRKARDQVDAKQFESFDDAFEMGGRRRVFGRIKVDGAEHGNRATSVSRALGILDQDFWQMLEEPEGIGKCIEILGSRVGSKNRSLVDAVYNTGLVYTNHLFQDGGIDRLGDLSLVEISTFEEVPPSCRNDVRRVVLFYYLFGELLGWADEGETFDPDRVAAVLVPVKMRGSVWGVVMHAVYTPEYESFFADQRYWQGYFKLATDLAMKNKQVFDRFMWGLADEMVTEALIEMVRDVLASSDADYEGAVDMLNLALRSMERKTPFALPEFEFVISEPSYGENYVRFPPDTDVNIWLSWKIVDNSLFVARQPWSLNATRNFVRIVRHAVLTAMNQASNAPRKT